MRSSPGSTASACLASGRSATAWTSDRALEALFPKFLGEIRLAQGDEIARNLHVVEYLLPASGKGRTDPPALRRLSQGRTVVTIAHRLSTAEVADRVFVFDAGRLVAEGTHAELVAGGGVYARLHASWLGNVGGGSEPAATG